MQMKCKHLKYICKALLVWQIYSDELFNPKDE